MKNSEVLWKEMSNLLRRYFKDMFKKFIYYKLFNDLERLVRACIKAVINTGQEDTSVEAETYQDVQEVKYRFNCLCLFSKYSSKALIL